MVDTYSVFIPFIFEFIQIFVNQMSHTIGYCKPIVDEEIIQLWSIKLMIIIVLVTLRSIVIVTVPQILKISHT